VDGYRIKESIKKITAISLESLDDGEQYWGRITGTKYDKITTPLGRQLHSSGQERPFADPFSHKRN